METDICLPEGDNGMNVSFGKAVHCVAGEPNGTFVRVGIVDRGQEVAYETFVAGQLRHGYRIFQLRGALGTRIELCHLLVRISFGTETNRWPSEREVRLHQIRTQSSWANLQQTVALKLRVLGQLNSNAHSVEEQRKHIEEIRDALERQASDSSLGDMSIPQPPCSPSVRVTRCSDRGSVPASPGFMSQHQVR